MVVHQANKSNGTNIARRKRREIGARALLPEVVHVNVLGADGPGLPLRRERAGSPNFQLDFLVGRSI